jgi:hypothetical protein
VIIMGLPRFLVTSSSGAGVHALELHSGSRHLLKPLSPNTRYSTVHTVLYGVSPPVPPTLEEDPDFQTYVCTWDGCIQVTCLADSEMHMQLWLVRAKPSGEGLDACRQAADSQYVGGKSYYCTFCTVKYSMYNPW